MPTTEQELVNTVRKITRLQTKARQLRRELKNVHANIRAERRNLRALTNELELRRPDVAPMRLFGGATGLAVHETELPPVREK